VEQKKPVKRYKYHSDARRVEAWWVYNMWWCLWQRTGWPTLTVEALAKCEMWRA